MIENEPAKNRWHRTSDEDLYKKITQTKLTIANDINSWDLKLSLFIAAAISYRHDSCCIPFPAAFRHTDTNVKDHDRLVGTIEKLPSLIYFMKTPDEDLVTDPDVIDLLHWIFIESEWPKLCSVTKRSFEKILQHVPQEGSTKKHMPTHIFEVLPDNTSYAETKFFEYQEKENYESRFAFHGTKLPNMHNILHHGLQQHLSKNALFGEGLYLSTELSVSLPYSRTGLGWDRSRLGDNLACVALCEVIEHPRFVTYYDKDNVQIGRPAKDLPGKYIVCRNNDLVRVRYLLVYASTTSNHKMYAKVVDRSWKRWFNFRTLAFVYLLILAAIGMSDSPYLNYLKKNFFRKLQSSFQVLMGRQN